MSKFTGDEECNRIKRSTLRDTEGLGTNSEVGVSRKLAMVKKTLSMNSKEFPVREFLVVS